MTAPSTPAKSSALHAIALFEAVKGVAAIAASMGLVSLAHHDARAMAYALIGHFHLSPDSHYPRALLDYATMLHDANLRQVVLVAWAYASIRLTEGFGLWKDRAWAEWIAALSGAVYLPLELSHLVNHPTVINGVVLVGNVGVVAYMALRLWQRRKSDATTSA
jgi:uncharacterized membrane protein (DUF2068 family)